MDTFQTALLDLIPRLRRLARILAWEPADADDLTQLTLERALIRRDQWQDGTRLDSWVFRIMKNAWIDEMRSRQRRARVLAPEELGDSIPDPGSATLDARLGVTAVERALAALPEEQKLAVTMVLVEGLSYQEASAVLDIPIGTLTSRLARGRAALQTTLLEQGAQP